MRIKITTKNIIIVIITLCIGVIVLCSYKYYSIPMLPFPLQKNALENALSASGLDWVVAKEEILKDGHVLFWLDNTQGQPSAIVSSLESKDKRILQINFLSSKDPKSNIPQEDWKKAIQLATILYGGFKNSSEVYDNFRQTYNEKAVIDDVPGSLSEFRERIRWENELNDIKCFLGFGVRKKGAGLAEAEFVSIIFSKTKD